MAKSNYVEFTKPFKFEGEEHKGVDLSGLEDMSTEQLTQAERIFERSGGVSALKELNLEYTCIIASIVTGKPLEFFKALPAKDGNKIKTQVGAYFFDGE